MENIKLLKQTLAMYRNMPMPSRKLDAMLHQRIKGVEAALVEEAALHEAVEHAESVARENQHNLCGEDHLQLARWLRELQNRRMAHYRRAVVWEPGARVHG